MTKLLLAAILGTVMGVSSAALAQPGDDSSPTPFRLLLEGGHGPSVGQENIHHLGRFSASKPACPSGSATDSQYVYPYAVLREHTCDDGSGTFTALIDPQVAEHGGAGAWKIVGGTGRYASLRGRGTFDAEFVSGSPTREETITFRGTWIGVAGFDDVAPSIRIVRASAKRLHRAKNTYSLRLAFRSRDDLAGNVVEYQVLPRHGSYMLPFAEGRVRTQTVSVTLKIRPPRSDLPIVVEVRVIDPLGNERRILRSVALPS